MSENEKKEEKKGFVGNLIDKLDKKIAEKANSSCCCCGPSDEKKDDKKKDKDGSSCC